MASLTIKYGDTVLSQDSGTVNKTLKTGGKYCENNFTVSMEEDATVVSYKYFMVTLSSAISGKWWDAIDADPDIAAHRNDSTFGLSWNCLTAPSAQTSTRSGIYTNAPMSLETSDGSKVNYGYYTRTNSSAVGACAKLQNLPTVKTTAAGAAFVDADGSISFYASSAYPIRAGTYQIVVWW